MIDILFDQVFFTNYQLSRLIFYFSFNLIELIVSKLVQKKISSTHYMVIQTTIYMHL